MMTSLIKKYILSLCVLMISAAAIHAQQRPSERPMQAEIQKINAKRAERNAYIARSQQTTATARPVATTSVPAQAGNTKPASSSNILPSQQPIKKPVIRRATSIQPDSSNRRSPR